MQQQARDGVIRKAQAQTVRGRARAAPDKLVQGFAHLNFDLWHFRAELRTYAAGDQPVQKTLRLVDKCHGREPWERRG